MRTGIRAVLCVVGALVVSSSFAQNFPAKPVRIVAPFPPGSVTDTLARPIAQRLSEAWKQPVVVENRAGAGGIIGATAVATATPDGYTLLMGSNGTNAINASLYSKLPYDPVKGFAPITQVATAHLLLVVHPTLEAKSVRELIALAKSKPGQLTFGSGGSGTNPHISGELFKMMTGVQLVHVPYKGSPQYVLDLLAGRLHMAFSNVAPALPHVRAGKLRVLGVTSLQRDPALPDVPTISEAGVPGYSAELWLGMFAPARTPARLVTKLNQEIRTVLANDELTRQFAAAGLVTKTSTPEAFAAYVRDETAKWAKVVKASGAKPD